MDFQSVRFLKDKGMATANVHIKQHFNGTLSHIKDKPMHYMNIFKIWDLECKITMLHIIIIFCKSHKKNAHNIVYIQNFTWKFVLMNDYNLL